MSHHAFEFTRSNRKIARVYVVHFFQQTHHRSTMGRCSEHVVSVVGLRHGVLEDRFGQAR